MLLVAGEVTVTVKDSPSIFVVTDSTLSVLVVAVTKILESLVTAVVSTTISV